MQYRVYDYDVWGNKKDGFEVNDTFQTPYKVELHHESSDRDIIKALKDVGFLAKHAKYSNFQIDGEYEYGLNITYLPTSYPLCELKPIR
jgi:hypothetical protein